LTYGSPKRQQAGCIHGKIALTRFAWHVASRKFGCPFKAASTAGDNPISLWCAKVWRSRAAAAEAGKAAKSAHLTHTTQMENLSQAS
jgi:hypothetical protein